MNKQLIAKFLGICVSAGTFTTYVHAATSTATTASDIQATLSATFTEIDTNQDKYLSLAEVEAWQDTQHVERFTSLDTDASSSLSLVELQANTTKNGFPEAITENLFKLLDNDSNSELSSAEFALLAPGKGGLIRHFAHMDTDGDLQISETEFLTAPPHHGGPGNQHGRH